MNRILVILLAAFCAVPGYAQPALDICVDERLPAQSRIGACTTALQLNLEPGHRAVALRHRANGRMLLVLTLQAVARQADPTAPIPPGEFDAALADVDESLALVVTGQALALRPSIRLLRGDLTAEARDRMMAGDIEGLVAALTTAITVNPSDWELFALRASHRAMIGAPGSETDLAEARRLLASRPR